MLLSVLIDLVLLISPDWIHTLLTLGPNPEFLFMQNTDFNIQHFVLLSIVGNISVVNLLSAWKSPSGDCFQ